MKIKYFEDTDTLFIKLKNENSVETKELNENIYLELCSSGKVVGITVEHAKERSDGLDFSFEKIAA